MLIDTQSKLASFLCQITYYDLGLDYPARYPVIIEAVSGQDVQRAAQQYLKPDELVISVVGDLEQIGDIAK